MVARTTCGQQRPPRPPRPPQRRHRRTPAGGRRWSAQAIPGGAAPVEVPPLVAIGARRRRQTSPAARPGDPPRRGSSTPRASQRRLPVGVRRRLRSPGSAVPCARRPGIVDRPAARHPRSTSQDDRPDGCAVPPLRPRSARSAPRPGGAARPLPRPRRPPGTARGLGGLGTDRARPGRGCHAPVAGGAGGAPRRPRRCPAPPGGRSGARRGARGRAPAGARRRAGGEVGDRPARASYGRGADRARGRGVATRGRGDDQRADRRAALMSPKTASVHVSHILASSAARIPPRPPRRRVGKDFSTDRGSPVAGHTGVRRVAVETPPGRVWRRQLFNDLIY